MATDVRALPASFTSNADFQSWVQGLQAQLAIGGFLVKTGDTGQINSATVTAPGASDTAQGYEIYRFSDALQATVPVFFKIEYGSGSAAAARPGLWITIGTGSNGSGTLTGVLSTRQQAPAASTIGGTRNHYACVTADSVQLLCNYANAQDGAVFGFGVDRSRDGSGTATSDGAFGFIFNGNATARYSAFVPPAGGPSPYGFTSRALAIGPAYLSYTSSVGGNVAICPELISWGKLLFSLSLLTYNNPDLGPNGSVAATHLGSAHTYFSTAMTWGVANTADRWAMRWE